MKKTLHIVFLSLIIVCFIFNLQGQSQSHNFDGQTITFGISKIGVQGSSIIEDFKEGEKNAHLQNIEEDFNVNIEFVELGGVQEQIEDVMSSVMAGDPVADVLHLHHAAMESLAPQGALLTLDDILDDKYFDSLPAPHRNKEVYKVGQKFYGFSTNHDFPGLKGVAWNKDMFESEGLPNLYELQESGEWTWDKFIEIAEELTTDTDGDGEIDRWGYQGIWRIFNPIVTWWHLYANDTAPLEFKDGEYVFTYNEEPALETLRFVHDLRNEHEVISPADAGFGRDLFPEGKIGMVVGTQFVLKQAVEQDMEDDYGWVFMPKGPNAEDYSAPHAPYPYFSIPLMTDVNPDALLELTNALFRLTSDYTNIENWSQENVITDWGQYLDDRESLETLQKMLENAEPKRFYIGPGMLGEVVGSTVNDVITGEESPSSAMDAIEPEAQTWIEDFFSELE